MNGALMLLRCLAAVFLLGRLAGAHVGAEEPMGVTSEAGTTTFRVWAPHARTVAVIGDFNNWKAMQGDHLVKDEATGIWSGTLRRSRPRGAYQFLINGDLPRRDPYARAASPDGKKSLFFDPASFKWGDDRAPGHALEDTVIYEMHIGTFYDPKPGDGMPATFDDAIERLDHLVTLGINTVCVLPVHEFNGNHSWGYNPSDPFAVEQAYGGPDGLKRFVQACHARGLAVHLDVVHNHYGPQNLDLLQFDGTGNPLNGGIYFYEGDGIGMTPWGPRVRFEQPMVRRYILDNALMWLGEYRVDGFRWDSTINIRAYNLGANPLPAGAAMLEQINREIRQAYPGRWSIAEDSLDIGNFDASWDYDFHHQVMPQLSAPDDENRDLRQIANALGRSGRMARVVYVDTHDEAGKINGHVRIASDIDPSNPGGDRARRLSGLGAALTFTAPGIPLLFMGNEFQEIGTFHDDIPLDWNKTRHHAGLLALHRDLIALRRNRDGATIGLKGAGITFPLINQEEKHVVYWRGHEKSPEDRVVVAINFSGQPAEMVIPFPSEGPWIMRLNSDWVTYGGAASLETKPFTLNAATPKARTRMAAYSARIFSLAGRPASPSTAPAKATAPVATAAKPPFSMYASIHLVGNFNDNNLTNMSLAAVADYRWEGTFVLRNVKDPAFKISANADGVIYWGADDFGGPAKENMTASLKRLGKNFAAAGIWDGTYRFRIDEDQLRLEIARLGDAPQEVVDEPPPEIFRIWTDLRGKTMEAMLLERDAQNITLKRRDGSTVKIPVDKLSLADQKYIRSQP
jgi:1,4-alpha-glucan branching enzyme